MSALISWFWNHISLASSLWCPCLNATSTGVLSFLEKACVDLLWQNKCLTLLTSALYLVVWKLMGKKHINNWVILIFCETKYLENQLVLEKGKSIKDLLPDIALFTRHFYCFVMPEPLTLRSSMCISFLQVLGFVCPSVPGRGRWRRWGLPGTLPWAWGPPDGTWGQMVGI